MARALAARNLLTDTSPDGLKRAAAARAVLRIRSNTIVGLGTGSTVRPLLELLAGRLAAGELTGVTGVPTSEDTASRCRSSGIPLTTLDEHPVLDLCIDGADEIGPGLALIKGLGGALLREKLVALAAKRFIIIADDSKRVRKLGTRSPLPVEVIPFGWTTHLAFFAKLGAEPVLRRAAGGEPYLTDGGHYIVDCRFAKGMADPAAVARALDKRPGIVDHGLFLRMADTAFVATSSGVREITA
jgi:ribose 5-phosphate isomerase A